MGGSAKHSFVIINSFSLPAPPIPNISSASLYPLFLSHMKNSLNIFEWKSERSERERQRVVLGVVGMGVLGSIMTFAKSKGQFFPTPPIPLVSNRCSPSLLVLSWVSANFPTLIQQCWSFQALWKLVSCHINNGNIGNLESEDEEGSSSR
ncbi:hypothetical protein QQP08_007687 [Theobroma cacao]|nr:hypothetical protein QQP08_007687 [Theobroma cacao]